jgi:hypothetical protein
LRESEHNEILAGARDFWWLRAFMLRSIIVEVPLDGAETKSEDYQRDASRNAAQGPTTALN